MTALAFLASLVVGLGVGACGLVALSLCMASSRMSREERVHPSIPNDLLRGVPFDDRKPEARR